MCLCFPPQYLSFIYFYYSLLTLSPHLSPSLSLVYSLLGSPQYTLVYWYHVKK